MANYRPQLDNTIPMILLIPQSQYSTKHGVAVKSYPAIKSGVQIFANFKTYGGTEHNVDGVYSVEDTAVCETWYRPDIKSDCRVYVPLNGGEYEIINEPENVNMRCQFLRFKVKRVKGQA